MNDYDNWLFDEEEDDGELIPRPKLHWAFKIIAFVILIAFLSLSFPWLKHLCSEQLNFFEENQTLKNDTLVIKAKPAIVSIQAVEKTERNSGTGFIISSDGIIVTNAHIIGEAESVKITLYNDEIYYSKSIEKIPENDLAIIYIDAINLPYLELEDKIVANGDLVTIIGNPLGYNKIAQRGLVGDFHSTNNIDSLVFAIAIDINPGNSGSPVINEAGKVVGVIFASISIRENDQTINQALAIPIQALFSFIKFE